MRVRIFSVLSTAALGLIFVAQATEARADVIFSNFGPGQTYQGASWWNVGDVPGTPAQVLAFSFTPNHDGDADGRGPGLGERTVDDVNAAECVYRVGFWRSAGLHPGCADAIRKPFRFMPRLPW